MAYDHDGQQMALENQLKCTRTGRNFLRPSFFYSCIAQGTSIKVFPFYLELLDAIVYKKEASGVKKHE
jgi:hypothetical protein